MQVHLRLIVSSESSMPVPTELRYYRNDPFAVHVDFHTRQDTASWVFSRSLLTEGLNKPVGGGDVRVWPSRSHGQGVVCIALSSPEGEALLEAPRRAIASFLRRTEQVVPLGDEATQIDFDLFTDYLRASPGEN
ncbi:SsgA family sporulation/cell division regulator [Streptacidiphilus rugosus]|uniref:SsgA family sporulation/cell division regulator n=1 Tax=Streptacidiphilus rugosus TaxID=405783 RepID=UPI00056BF57B|nr:SsgA family sporulation/cell division regulator [Streptacidiphilus rugosus]